MKKEDLSGNIFSVLIKSVRKKHGISLEQLAYGLIDVSSLAKSERGARNIGKSLRDRILGRLGISGDQFENLLQKEEYEEYLQKNKIIYAIEHEEVQSILNELNIYLNSFCNNKVNLQFYYYCLAEYYRITECDKVKIQETYKKALQQTVPDIYDNLQERILSIQEINIALDIYCYEDNQTIIDVTEELLNMVKDSRFSHIAKAKIVPRIVYIFGGVVLAEKKSERYKEIVSLIDDAISLLQEDNKAYFLIELLDLKISLIEQFEEEDESKEYRQTANEAMTMRMVFKKLFEKYGSVYMKNSVYIYRMKSGFALSEVIYNRRKMLGLSRSQLAEGICSEKTIMRIEQGKTNIQKDVLVLLLKELGLSSEIQKAQIVADNREALRYLDDIVRLIINCKSEESLLLLGEMKQHICEDITENEQYFKEKESVQLYRNGTITKSECLKKIKECFRITCKADAGYLTGAVYLTEEELTCIHHMCNLSDGEEKERYMAFLRDYCHAMEQKQMAENHVSMYEFLLQVVANEMGNLGKYEDASRLEEELLRVKCRCRRINGVAGCLYNIWWNDKQQSDNTRPIEETISQLEESIMISDMAGETSNSEFCRGVLDREIRLHHVQE